MRKISSFFAFLSIVFISLTAKSQSWQPLGPDDQIEPSLTSVDNLSMAIDGSGHPYIVYRDQANGYKASVKKFNGSSWEYVGPSAISTGNASSTVVAIDPTGTPYIAYGDGSNGYKATVKKFDGTNWIDVGTPGFSSSSASYISMVFDGMYPYVAYSENLNITVKKFDGSNWQTVGSAGFASGPVFYISLALNASGMPYVSYSDDTYQTIVVQKFNGSAWQPVGTSISNPSTNYLSMALDISGNPYVAYQDGANSNKISVKKYNGSSWDYVGSAGFSAGAAAWVSIKTDGSGIPYVIYNDGGSSGNAIVQKFDGSSWVNIPADAPSGTGGYNNLAFDASGNLYIAITQANYASKAVVKKLSAGILTTLTPMGITGGAVSAAYMVTKSNGIPYIVYEDDNNSSKISVKKFDGNNWVLVGSAGFSSGIGDYTCIAVGANGFPYVLYRDNANGNKATVKMYNGSNWIDVGTPGFSAGTVSVNSIAIDRFGTPYIAYNDGNNSNKATVKMYNGSNWIDVGTPGFSAGATTYLTIVTDAAGTPYVAYTDAGNSNKAMVKKFDGTNWTDVGTAGISPGKATGMSFGMDGTGNLYLSYLDATNSSAAMVKKFDGSSWTDIGTGVTGYKSTRLGIDGNNTLYIVYTSGNSSITNFTIKKFDGASWSDVGVPIVSAPYAANMSIAFGAGNVPLVVHWYGGLYAKSFGTFVSLPLRLTEFNGRVNNSNALLSWKTDNEVNTREFIIERSTDGRSYTKAGSVEAVNTSGVHQYIFTDPNINMFGTTVVYYRLQQKDIDGKITYSRIVALPVGKISSRVLCYPNPVIGEANIVITTDKAEPIKMRIIDNKGRVLQLQQWNISEGSTSLSVNMSTLPKGIYYLDIRSNTINKKISIVKQ